ncbi:SHOCT domain-containing protein [Mycobacterium sp. CVI_P3]|uniref:SHOCT domain-containing protein n=1 Tax=Mycobacterium pinniadriaticum TaxID=2994102 RepID=A0ABT3SA65_9MYCO|nr:SHOCT domain-containing protein [Mycobacterium pinniadriaticum]MCX2929630.1 SHOCT domain-containing protein [Mycobacterium pinniadriaticum]MCX2936054.1 SHOCT domain-containing protein [Mycobacterium pinniadriaticum]
MSRTIAGLSALWWVLIVVPALVGARMLDQAGSGPATGWVLGVWLAGYVAQFVVFLMMSRRAPLPVLPGWIISSVVPWAADWTAPLSPWWLGVWTAVVLGYASWLVVAVSRVDRLRRDGVRGAGIVLAVIRPMFNVVVNKDAGRRVLRLRIERSDGAPPYEAQLTGTFTLGEVPEPDDRVAVRVDPGRPNHVELIDDEPVLRAAPQPTDLEPDVAERLQMLKTMRDRGDLTEAEFATARERLLAP